MSQVPARGLPLPAGRLAERPHRAVATKRPPFVRDGTMRRWSARRHDASTLADTLARQRRAYRLAPVPTLDERRQDLLTLQRFVREHTDAICDAISADYGHRSRHETLLAEIIPSPTASTTR